MEVLKTMIRDAYKQQKHSKCIEYIDQAPKNMRESSQYKILKASCINNIGGKSSEAHTILDSVIKSEASNAFAYYGKGLVFINDGMLAESVECFDTAIKIDPSEKMDKARQMKSRVEKMMRPMKKLEVSRAGIVNVNKPEARQRKTTTNGEEKHCKVCLKTFAKSFSLSRHMQLHTGERPHKCHVCGYAFIQKSDLNRHLATHSDVANFQCNICLKRFKTKKNLHCHGITHSTLRPFKCSHCNKTFKLKRLLVFHEGVHKNVKPYSCDICGKGFPAKPHIKTHLKSHFPVNKKTLKKEKSKPMEIKTEIFFEDEQMAESAESSDHIIQGIMDSNDKSLTFGDLVCDGPESKSDLNFCLSLLKIISGMNDEQKAKFKDMTNANIDEILNQM